MASQSWNTLLNWGINSHLGGATLSASSSITDVSPAPQFFFPVNFLQIGSQLRVTAAGTLVSAASTPGTLTLGVYYGAVAGTALATGGANTLVASAASWSWRLEWTGRVTAVGSSGSIFGNGYVLMPASLTQFQAAYAMPATAPAAVSIDTTTSKALTVGATFSSATTNTLTLNQVMIESMA